MLVRSKMWGNPDTILDLAIDATGRGLQSYGNKTSLSDAIFPRQPVETQLSEMSDSTTKRDDTPESEGLFPEAAPDPNSNADSSLTVPQSGVLFGIDYGTRRVGVAVSDRDQRFSSPLHNHERHGVQVDERFFRKAVEEYRPVGLVIGLPIHLSGDESEKSREARKFAEWLGSVTGLPYTFQDERFTSFQAEKLLLAAELSKKKRKERMDKLAAQILLQTFLDARIAGRV